MFISVLPYGIRLRVSDAIQQWLPFTARGIEFASFSVTTGSCFVVLYNGISWERTQLSNNREYDPGIAFQISKGSFEWFKVFFGDESGCSSSVTGYGLRGIIYFYTLPEFAEWINFKP